MNAGLGCIDLNTRLSDLGRVANHPGTPQAHFIALGNHLSAGVTSTGAQHDLFAAFIDQKQPYIIKIKALLDQIDRFLQEHLQVIILVHSGSADIMGYLGRHSDLLVTLFEIVRALSDSVLQFVVRAPQTFGQGDKGAGKIANLIFLL